MLVGLMKPLLNVVPVFFPVNNGSNNRLVLVR